MKKPHVAMMQLRAVIKMQRNPGSAGIASRGNSQTTHTNILIISELATKYEKPWENMIIIE